MALPLLGNCGVAVVMLPPRAPIEQIKAVVRMRPMMDEKFCLYLYTIRVKAAKLVGS